MRIKSARDVAKWLTFNSIEVMSIDPPVKGFSDYDQYNPHIVNCTGDIAVIVYEQLGVANVVLRGDMEGRSPKMLESVETYNEVVSNVKRLRPFGPETMWVPVLTS